MPAKSETVDSQHSDEERVFLLTAFKNWSKPEEFSDEQVAKAKTIFQRVFKDASKLMGGEFADALVMQPVNDLSFFYAMVVGDQSEITWKRVCVNATNYQILNSHLTKFEHFISIVGIYCH